jgi:hypothetical protein
VCRGFRGEGRHVRACMRECIRLSTSGV